MQGPEDYKKYRENPIFGTDFNKSITEILEDVRNKLTSLRGGIKDLKYGYPAYKERIDYFDGYFTTGILALYSTIEGIKEIEIMKDDNKYGKSYSFTSRGFGLENCPGCFVCGGNIKLMNNISAFVNTKEDGMEIVSWFKNGAYLDFRQSEPNWIQVKIGSCDKHKNNLEILHNSSSVYNVLRSCDVSKAINLNKKEK